MMYRELVSSLIKATQRLNISREELGLLSGYGDGVKKWFADDASIPLVQYIDWAESLGYEVLLIKKGVKISVSERHVPTEE